MRLGRFDVDTLEAATGVAEVTGDGFGSGVRAVAKWRFPGFGVVVTVREEGAGWRCGDPAGVDVVALALLIGTIVIMGQMDLMRNSKLNETGKQIVSIRFADDPAALFPNYARSGTSRQPLYRECEKQLKAYFAGQRRSFDFPMQQPGTDFQQRVWNALLRIPFGKTISYLELSLQLGDAKAIRAVGTANGKNNLAIVVPCHRVIEIGRAHV